jgi:NADH pyrophosphatase NudC (nudix superfamily)
VRIEQVFDGYDRNHTSSIEPFKYCPLCGSRLTSGYSGGKRRMMCSNCRYIHYRNPYPGVVVLIEKDGMILLGKRLGRYGRGKWCIPGGYIEYEEDFLTAAHREIKEETGLNIQVKSILSVASNYLSPELHTLVVVLLAHVAGGSAKAGDDIEELRWFMHNNPLPEMAFPADRNLIQTYWRTKFKGVPVDTRFATKV